MKQRKNTFDYVTLKKTLKGALIAGGGVCATYILQEASSADFGAYSALVAGVCSILINLIKEYHSGNSYE